MLSSTLRSRALALVSPFVLLLAACGGSDNPTGGSTTSSSRAGEAKSTGTVAFGAPANGAAVAGGVGVSMTAQGINIEKAGSVRDGAGHFHVIAGTQCVTPGTAIVSDADHIHVDDGQSNATIYLEPGAHRLCLQVGDGAHFALDATDTVTIDVGIVDHAQWCEVSDEVNELFDGNDDVIEFAKRQVGYENARRLLAQLSDALDQVDADVRSEVANAIDFGRIFATAYIESEDDQGAFAAIEKAFAREGAPRDPGPGSATSILAKCGAVN